MSERPENLSAAEAAERLVDGNARYRQDRHHHPNRHSARREELVAGQRPFASILTCSDSRVSPEIVFDQGLGDLFVIRVAGHVSSDTVLGSLEYASLQLGVNLIVVMGHARCGAVEPALNDVQYDGPATHSHIDALIEAIRPAVLAATRDGNDDPLDASIRENARMVADTIRGSSPPPTLAFSAGCEIRPAHYDLASGRVSWLLDER